MGGQKNFNALFYVLDHCSYEYDFFNDFFIFFLFFPEKVQESRGVNTVNIKSFELGLMNSTKRKFDKKPGWRSIYERQLLDLLDRGFAKEV